MNEMLKNKLASIIGKMDEKVLEAKLNAALDMLKNKNTDELREKMKGINKEELLEKLDEVDEKGLGEFKANRDDIRQKLETIDINKVNQVLGENGEEILKKIKDILK